MPVAAGRWRIPSTTSCRRSMSLRRSKHAPHRNTAVGVPAGSAAGRGLSRRATRSAHTIAGTYPCADDDGRFADLRAHLAAAREPRATGAGPDAGSLRRAYLDLLKLALCDLAGSSTTSVGAMADGTVLSRELRGDERRVRA